MTYLAQPRNTGLYAALASAAILSAAYISQYGFGLDPCILCYYQRIPYFFIIPLGLAAFFVGKKSVRAATVLVFLCGVGFFIDAGIAAFHVGVEHKWWKGLEACGNAALPSDASVEELRNFITSRKPVDCSVPAFVLFGISMAGYNLLMATGLMLDVFILLWWRWKHEKKNVAR